MKRIPKTRQCILDLFDELLPNDNKALNTLKTRSELTYCNLISSPKGKLPIITANIRQVTILFLIDTGSNCSLLMCNDYT